jgi:rod shape determining protein RodA
MSALAALALLAGGIALVVAGAEAFFEGLLATARRRRIPVFTLTALVSGFELENLAAGIAANAKGLPGAAAGTFLGGTTFLAAGVAGLACLPIAWSFMHGYQRRRVLTFLDPSSDPLGAGYHITQSKIAIGSGGLFGKGLGQGTQAALNFLPEKQTDFIFTTFVEEWGMVGALVLLALFALVLMWGYSIALRSHHHFGRLVALGVTAMMFLYVFINTAMVMGLLPVVGVPLPLVSNGGTAMVSVMFACGLLIGVNVYRDAQLPLRR